MNTSKNSCDAACTCRANLQKEWNRRDFIKATILAAGVITGSSGSVMAGPFVRKEFEKLVPADKKLTEEWLRSLTDRGTSEVYRGAELDKIGMPIGGICAGQVYVGGDGALWHWDIFNKRIPTGAEHYAKPLVPSSPFSQGFALRVHAGATTQDRALAKDGWRDITFRGEYPIAWVTYSDPDCPVQAELQTYSPFIPLNVDDSSLPVTVRQYTIHNRGNAPVEVDVAGWLENPVCLHSSNSRNGRRRNRLARRNGLLALVCSAEAAPMSPAPARSDVMFDSFERRDYAPWIATGTAFGAGPVELTKVPEYQGDLRANGKRAVNSHATAPGADVGERDAAKGTLTSALFKIERDYITFLLGGGNHGGNTCINLLIDGKVVMSSAGPSNNQMRPTSWDVRRWAGLEAQLQIVDNESGPWGNIGVDDIVFTDRPRPAPGDLAAEPDYGSAVLALLEPQSGDRGATAFEGDEFPVSAFAESSQSEPVSKPFPEKVTGGLARRLKLAPDQSASVTFLIAWHLTNLSMERLPKGRHYATRFGSALAVAEYVASEFPRLSATTRLWHDTWYESTLPYWFLNRTFLNTSILATSTCYRLGNGRFWAWEGVGCCEGTCGHVWQYAHAVARLFPELERITRENVDFDLALQPDGAIHFRGEFNNIPAIDAQAGTILRALREHQHSRDDAFLKRIWPKVKRATEWLIRKDGNSDSLIEGNQHNTLDTDWFGPVAWLSGIYLAALAAAEAMAQEVGDGDFAAQCREIANQGRNRLPAELFNGEYFINKPDPAHLDAINSGTGCHIDQVFGQSWAFQVGLPRVLPRKETLTALRSLWRYNFTPDVGPYRDVYRPGRWYAMAGEAGLLMCTFPQSDWDYAQAKGKGPDWAAGYFNECMNGFEYQVAGHMIWEGMVTEGLAIARAVHDRYHPTRRNPWNEVECGDHYARSMASYGVFLAACGYQYHGPQGKLGFAPKFGDGHFRAAFTTAEGWGIYTQEPENGEVSLELHYGTLELREVSVPRIGSSRVGLETSVDGESARSKIKADDAHVKVEFSPPLRMNKGQRLLIRPTRTA